MKHQLLDLDFVCQDTKSSRIFEVMYRGITIKTCVVSFSHKAWLKLLELVSSYILRCEAMFSRVATLIHKIQNELPMLATVHQLSLKFDFSVQICKEKPVGQFA